MLLKHISHLVFSTLFKIEKVVLVANFGKTSLSKETARSISAFFTKCFHYIT